MAARRPRTPQARANRVDARAPSAEREWCARNMPKRALEPAAAAPQLVVNANGDKANVTINNHNHAAPDANAMATAIARAIAMRRFVALEDEDEDDEEDVEHPVAQAVPVATATPAPAPADDDVESDEDDEDDVVESVDARRARLKRAWRETKDAIMGTPVTWGINPQTKRPRGRQPARSTAAKEATVRDHDAHAHEIGAAFGGRITFWRPKTKCFVTQLHEIPGLKKNEVIISHSWADALRAHAAATACADAHNSFVAQAVAKKQRVAVNAPKRADDLAKCGDNCALERRELVRLRDVVEGGKLRVLILPDGCRFDALVRTKHMPKGRWLAWQHKSTHKSVRCNRGSEGWRFNDVKGYADAIVVCTVANKPGLVWVVRGKVLDEGKSEHLWVTKDKVTAEPWPLPADGKTLPTPLGDVARVLEVECAKVVARDATALPTFTVEEAETMGKGKTLDVERAGVLAWMRCLHGGAVPWVEMPDALQRDARNVRLMRDGTVIAYPDGQNTKTDLEVLQYPDGTKTTHQFKTAKPRPGQFGLQVHLETTSGHGKGKKRMDTNTYRLGDNDYYTIVLPDTEAAGARAGRVDVWTIPEAELATRGLFGTTEDPVAKVGSFSVYHDDGKGKPRTHGWTRDYHRAFVRGADGAWVEEK